MNQGNTKPLVSVIMPVYNGEAYCERSIKSILNQTYRQIELIVINDGSKDSTADIIGKLAESDSRIVAITQENSGVSAARNRGIVEAKGDYIAFVDSDDFMIDSFVEKMLKAIVCDQSDVAVCGYKNVYSDGRKTERLLSVGKDTTEIIEEIITTNMINLIWNKLYKKDLIHNLFNVDKLMGEDLEFNIQYFMNVHSVSIVNEALYEYTHDSAGSLTKNENLVWNAVAEDWTCLNELQRRGIDSAVIDNKMFSYLLYIIERQDSRDAVKKVLDFVSDNDRLKDLIGSGDFHSITHKIARIMVNHKADGLLFGMYSLKKKMKSLI